MPFSFKRLQRRLLKPFTRRRAGKNATQNKRNSQMAAKTAATKRKSITQAREEESPKPQAILTLPDIGGTDSLTLDKPVSPPVQQNSSQPTNTSSIYERFARKDAPPTSPQAEIATPSKPIPNLPMTENVKTAAPPVGAENELAELYSTAGAFMTEDIFAPISQTSEPPVPPKEAEPPKVVPAAAEIAAQTPPQTIKPTSPTQPLTTPAPVEPVQEPVLASEPVSTPAAPVLESAPTPVPIKDLQTPSPSTKIAPLPPLVDTPISPQPEVTKPTIINGDTNITQAADLKPAEVNKPEPVQERPIVQAEEVAKPAVSDVAALSEEPLEEVSTPAKISSPPKFTGKDIDTTADVSSTLAEGELPKSPSTPLKPILKRGATSPTSFTGSPRQPSTAGLRSPPLSPRNITPGSPGANDDPAILDELKQVARQRSSAWLAKETKEREEREAALAKERAERAERERAFDDEMKRRKGSAEEKTLEEIRDWRKSRESSLKSRKSEQELAEKARLAHSDEKIADELKSAQLKRQMSSGFVDPRIARDKAVMAEVWGRARGEIENTL